MRGKACSAEFMRKFSTLVDSGMSSSELEDLLCMKRNEINQLERALAVRKRLGGVLIIQHLQPSHCMVLAALPEEKQLEMARQAEEGKWTVKELKARIQEQRQQEADRPMVEGQFHAIVIDPPWPMEKIERDVRPNQDVMDYPTMSLEQIRGWWARKDIPAHIPTAGAHIYLWTTHRFLPEALNCFNIWGVNYQCLLTWVKNVGMTPYSWMYSTEHCLFGRIGALPLVKNGERLDFSAPVTRHSEKPNKFYELVEKVSPNPWVDMFARKLRPGWEAWGNEV